MGGQHELRRNLHLAVAVLLEGRKVPFVFVGIHLLPVSVISCKWKEKEEMHEK